MAEPDKLPLPHRPWFPLLLYVPLAVLVSLLVVPLWGWTYWDFGDGNYMYIARRVREGVVLYDQILAPQPPLHTWAGVVAQELGARLLGSPLLGTRVYCLAIRLLAGLAVLLLAQRYFRCPFRAIAAAAIYLFLPIGFWWSLGYQSENLENVFLVFALVLFISWEPRQLALAGVASALACHCNMTGLPYLLVNALFLAFRRPKLLPWYLIPAVAVYAGIALVADLLTNGAFISNVLLNQVGTFPRTDILQASDPGDSFLGYVMRKVPAEALKVLDVEGGFVAAALVGALLVLLRPADADPEEEKARRQRDEFLTWSFVGMLLSICFTAKGGTVNYIFTLGEPGVALFAAHAVVSLWRMALPRTAATWRELSIWDTRLFLRVLFPLLVMGLMVIPSWRNLGFTFREQQVELNEAGVLELRSFIETYAKPGDPILAPPFYAFLTDTVVAGELAENYIWQIKYLNESFDRAPGEAHAKMAEVAQLLREGKAPVVLLDMAQTGRIPEIRAALQERYQPAELHPDGTPFEYHTRNTRLGLYIPKEAQPHHPPLAPQ